MTGGRAAGAAPDPAAPGPPPEALLEALLATLREADLEGAAAALNAVASQAMRARVGGAAGLARALRNELYGPLVGPREARIEGLERRGASARSRLELVAADGTPAVYLVALARSEHGPHAGRWRLSGLRREGAGP